VNRRLTPLFLFLFLLNLNALAEIGVSSGDYPPSPLTHDLAGLCGPQMTTYPWSFSWQTTIPRDSRTGQSGSVDFYASVASDAADLNTAPEILIAQATLTPDDRRSGIVYLNNRLPNLRFFRIRYVLRAPGGIASLTPTVARYGIGIDCLPNQ